MKTSAKIPYKQALKLVNWRAAYGELQPVIQAAQQRLEGLRQRLVQAHEFADIPLDKDVDVKIEEYDGSGSVVVEWQQPDKENGDGSS